MDTKLTKLLVAETRKSLDKLRSSEENFKPQTGNEDLFAATLHNPAYNEAEMEIKLFIKQLENQTQVAFDLPSDAFFCSENATKSIEINLQAIERLIEVFELHQNGAQEQNKTQ